MADIPRNLDPNRPWIDYPGTDPHSNPGNWTFSKTGPIQGWQYQQNGSGPQAQQGTQIDTGGVAQPGNPQVTPWNQPQFPIGGSVAAAPNGLTGGSQNLFGPFGNNFQASPFIYDPAAFAPGEMRTNLGNSQADFLNTLRGQIQNNPMAANANSPAYLQTMMAQQQAANRGLAMASSAQGSSNPGLAFRNAFDSINQGNAQAQQIGSLGRANETANMTGILNAGYGNALSNQQQLTQNQIAYQANQAAAIQSAQGLNASAAASAAALNGQFAGGLLNAAGTVGAAGVSHLGGGTNNPTSTTIPPATPGTEPGTANDAPSSSDGGGTALMYSDKKLKKDIKEEVPNGQSDLYDFLDKLKAYQYEYKNQANGAGKQFSPMAQDLEKSPVGEAMVKDTAKGKQVDYGKGFGAILAAQAQLHARLKALEGKK